MIFAIANVDQDINHVTVEIDNVIERIETFIERKTQGVLFQRFLE